MLNVAMEIPDGQPSSICKKIGDGNFAASEVLPEPSLPYTRMRGGSVAVTVRISKGTFGILFLKDRRAAAGYAASTIWFPRSRANRARSSVGAASQLETRSG